MSTSIIIIIIIIAAVYFNVEYYCSGWGKTSLALALAELWLGSRSAVVRMDF